jgi:leader peptidase (prepilin peptidase)/N-methyltransferase
MLIIWLFLVGLAVGSFLNVLIDRLPKNKSIVGRSRCDFCHKKLKTKDLVPIFSFVFLSGRCRYCRKRLSWQYPLVELLTGITFVLSWLYLPVTEPSVKIVYLGLFSSLIVIFFADWKYRVIPDQTQIILFVFVLAIIYFKGVFDPLSLLVRLADGILVMLPILLLYLVTQGKGMGFADVKLAFIIGFFLQTVAGLYAIYFGFVTGAVLGIFMIFFRKKKLRDVIAFGPFLALGFVVMIIFGQSILEFTRNFYFDIAF